MHKNLRILYITTESLQQAEDIGELIVKDELAACVNIIPGMKSIYRWEGDIQKDNETILIVKTHISKVQSITNLVNDAHTYECPCVISLNIAEDEGNEEYLKWLLKESSNR